jgi:hypothetical protein
MARGGWKGRLSPEEKEWTAHTAKRMTENGEKITHVRVNTMQLVDEYQRKFGKRLTVSGLFNRLWRNANPESHKMIKSKHKRPEQVFENSQFLVFIKGAGIFGWDTEEEVKASLERGKVLSDISIFKKIPSSVEYKVTIGTV